MRKTPIALLATLSLVVIGACGTTNDSAPSGASQTAESSPSTKVDAPKKVETPKQKAADDSSKGKGAITWGNWQVVGKIQVTKNALDLYEVKARVKNTKSSADTGIFTVNMLKGTEILGQATCTTPEVGAGQVGTASCMSGDTFKPGWTEITIEDAM